MSDLGQVLELMHTSSERWASLRLHGHEWRHLKTFSRAWEHDASELRETGSVSVQSVRLEKLGGGKPPEESRENWRVWLAKPDKKRTQFLVGDQVVTAVFIGERWWSWSPLGFRTNIGALNSSHGFGPAEGLVDPARHIASLHMRVDGRAILLARPAFRVTAVPRIYEPHGFDPTFHMLGTGADVYKLVVDAAVGILLRCQAEFHGDPFRVIEVDQIGVDEQFEQATFDPELPRDTVIDP
jgi:hypothetical protein